MKRIAVLLLLFGASQAHGQALLLFGGRNNDVFIGCVNCNRYDDGSICNRYSDVGSKYSDQSIWNPYGTFGSKYNDESPWNKYSSNPPVVVDRDGNFYGHFTANRYHQNRTRVQVLAALADNVDLVMEDRERARELICEN